MQLCVRECTRPQCSAQACTVSGVNSLHLELCLAAAAVATLLFHAVAILLIDPFGVVESVVEPAMGSIDWKKCYWCDYWVRFPYLYDFPWGDFGAVCDWCDTIMCEDEDISQHPQWHWWCRRNKRTSLYLDLQRAGFVSEVAWNIVLYTTPPLTLPPPPPQPAAFHNLQTSLSRGVSQPPDSFDNPFGPWSYDALQWAYCHDDHPANYMGYPPIRGEPADAEPNEHGDEPRVFHVHHHINADVPDFSSEGMRHIPLKIIQYTGYRFHQCGKCINAFARVCKSIHRWFYSTYDLPDLQDPLPQRR